MRRAGEEVGQQQTEEAMPVHERSARRDREGWGGPGLRPLYGAATAEAHRASGSPRE
jgi:hypothetical protein